MPLAAARTLRTVKYAMSFDGIDDYASISNIYFGGEITVEALFWDKNITSYYGGTVYGWETADQSNRILLNHVADYGKQRFEVYINGTSNTAYSTDIIPDRFVHATGIFSASEGVTKLYWDSELIGIKNFTPFSLTPISGTSQIGRFRSAYYFTGKIAFVRIYSRALTEDEIRWNYEHPDNPVRNGLVLWLHARPEYVSGNTWVDLSGLGNNATIYGATLEQIIKSPTRALTPTRTLSPTR